MSRRKRPSAIRQRIAQEAARLLAQHACTDYRSACRKAAEKLGCNDQRQLPDNREIESALQSYQQLFQAHSQPAALQKLRRLAVDAMRNLQQFDPHLTGEVLNGTASQLSPLRLYLFADTPEQLALHLMSSRIPFQQRDVRLNYADGSKRSRVLFSFQAGETRCELMLLPPADRSNPPIDPLEQRPHIGAPLARVQALFDQPGTNSSGA